MQTIKPKKIIILLDEKDGETFKECERFNGTIEVRRYKNNTSKADALNRAIKEVDTFYTMVVDVGDVLASPSYIEEMISKIREGGEVVVPRFTVEGKNFVKKMMKYELEMWRTILEKMYQKHRFCPLPGTGIIFRTDFLKRRMIPETLAEDAALGLWVRKVCFGESFLIYNLPRQIKDHLKQRARWCAGFLQNLCFARSFFQRWLSRLGPYFNVARFPDGCICSLWSSLDCIRCSCGNKSVGLPFLYGFQAQETGGFLLNSSLVVLYWNLCLYCSLLS